MKLALIQSDIVWEDRQANLLRLEGLLERAAGADLAVLPEMFSYGFITEPEGLAESPDGPTLQWMRSQAAARSMALAGSVPTALPDGSFRNRLYFVHPDGTVQFYDKRHLFTYGSEHLHYTPGSERVTVPFQGRRILLQVCYDLRFPVFSRNRPDEPYDLALYAASWPSVRAGAWSSLLKARAIENQCFVAGVNRVGTDPTLSYDGRSVLLSPTGEALASCTPSQEDIQVAEIDFAVLDAFRSRFPVLRDADR